MAENQTPEPETDAQEVEKSPGKIRTFFRNNKRTVIALAVAGLAGGAAGGAAGVKVGRASSNSNDVVPGEVTSSTDTPTSEA